MNFGEYYSGDTESCDHRSLKEGGRRRRFAGHRNLFVELFEVVEVNSLQEGERGPSCMGRRWCVERRGAAWSAGSAGLAQTLSRDREQEAWRSSCWSCLLAAPTISGGRTLEERCTDCLAGWLAGCTCRSTSPNRGCPIKNGSHVRGRSCPAPGIGVPGSVAVIQVRGKSIIFSATRNSVEIITKSQVVSLPSRQINHVKSGPFEG